MSAIWLPSDILVHHGIKGQRWGQKNGPPYPLTASSYSSAEKYARSKMNFKGSMQIKGLSDKQKKYIKIGAIAVGASIAICGGVYLHKTLEPNYGFKSISFGPLKDHLNDFSDNNGVNYGKGTVFKRISSDANADYINRGATYVSKLFNDKMKYAARLPTEQWNQGKQVYVHSLKANTDIKTPSSREAAKLYLELNPDARQSDFMNFMTYGIRNSEEMRDQFVKKLKSNGYNALIDENDYGWTKAPIILIDPSETTNVSSTRKLRKAEEVIATILQ